MKRTLFCAVLLALLSIPINLSAVEWQRLSAPIMSPWGEKINPESVWQEYPRPSLVRSEWMNLNGIWDFYYRTNNVDMDYMANTRVFSREILVPFGVESALSGLALSDYRSISRSTLYYRRSVSLPESFRGRRVLMHFGAVDWRCKVYVNGQEAGSHTGGSDPFTIDITDCLVDGETQDIEVAVNDPTSDGGQPVGKQTLNPGGIWYTPVSGIWQTVWLEPVNASHIEGYEVLPDIDQSKLTLRINSSSATAKATVKILYKGSVVRSATGVAVNTDLTFTIPNAKLWTPDEPNLYDLELTLQENNVEVDQAKGYFGMRKFSRGMVDGHPAFLLNNKPFYMYGPLDQGWWPDGLLTPPSYEAMIFDLQTIKDFGMNMVRKHIKVEPDLWYEWCDRNGLVVWQDMPNGGTGGSLGSKAEVQQIFYDESVRIVDALKHHPSIGVWVVYNEGWGQDAENGSAHTFRGVTAVRNADRDEYRLINSVTGWTDFELGDIVDVHSYPAPGVSPNPANERVAVCGEFGGITLELDGHLWAGSQQVYTAVSNGDALTSLYNSYTDRLQSLQMTGGLWGSVYTQITDVEQEVNGLLTYDRKVLKVTEAQKQSIRDKIIKTINYRYTGYDVVVPAGNAERTTWYYTTTEPSGEWMSPNYNVSSWRTGEAGFGTNAGARTRWNSSDIWIRREFNMDRLPSGAILDDLCLNMYYDEDTEVYINGVLACKITGYNTSYQSIDISSEAKKAIKLSGSNVIAIHCHQTEGGQYIDAGLILKHYKANTDYEVTEIPLAEAPNTTPTSDDAYLMAYFTEAQEKLVYAYSYDGLTWENVNVGRSVFNGYDETLRIRDPYMARVKQNGRDVYHLVHTWGLDNQGIYHWQSEDLINWTAADGGTDGRVMVMDGSMGTVVASNAYAPEFVYDEASGTYYIYWCSMFSGRMRGYCTTTKDWISFGRVYELTNIGDGVNDLHVVKAGNIYHAYFFNTSTARLCHGTFSSLERGRCALENVQQCFSQTYPTVTSPTTYPTFDGKGRLLLTLRNGEPMLFGTTDLVNLKWHAIASDDFKTPDDMLQGSVVTITRDELSKIIDAFNYEEVDLISTAEESNNERWSYSLSEDSGWNKPEYDDTSWNVGTSGFGNGTPPGSVIRTTWNTANIYLRHKLDLTDVPESQFSNLLGRIYYDEDVEVYLNGVLAYSATGFLTGYKNIGLNAKALAALRPDDTNVVGIHCFQTAGGQYIDFGMKGVKHVATGIQEQPAASAARTTWGIYNLNGQQIAAPSETKALGKGIYIINGKKVVVK